MPKFSIRVLAAVVAVLAVSLGLLRNPTPAVAMGVSAVMTVAMIAAASLAGGFGQPNRSFCAAFVIASVGVLWVNHGETPKSSLGLSRASLELADWADGYLGWSKPQGKPLTTEFFLDDRYLYGCRFDGQGNYIDRTRVPLRTATAEQLAKAIRFDGRLPVPDLASFQSIAVQLSALIAGILSGWIAWASRRRAMQSGFQRPSAD